MFGATVTTRIDVVSRHEHQSAAWNSSSILTESELTTVRMRRRKAVDRAESAIKETQTDNHLQPRQAHNRAYSTKGISYRKRLLPWLLRIWELSLEHRVT
jgi:hypothetical protein